jgi:hypothetical protein
MSVELGVSLIVPSNSSVSRRRSLLGRALRMSSPTSLLLCSAPTSRRPIVLVLLAAIVPLSRSVETSLGSWLTLYARAELWDPGEPDAIGPGDLRRMTRRCCLRRDQTSRRSRVRLFRGLAARPMCPLSTLRSRRRRPPRKTRFRHGGPSPFASRTFTDGSRSMFQALPPFVIDQAFLAHRSQADGAAGGLQVVAFEGHRSRSTTPSA